MNADKLLAYVIKLVERLKLHNQVLLQEKDVFYLVSVSVLSALGFGFGTIDKLRVEGKLVDKLKVNLQIVLAYSRGIYDDYVLLIKTNVFYVVIQTVRVFVFVQSFILLCQPESSFFHD